MTEQLMGVVIHKKELVIDEIELDVDEPKVPHHDEIIWARLTIKDASPVYIGAYYRPTSSYAADTITSLQSSIEYINTSLIKDNTRATVILGGDFNVPEINWDTSSVMEGSTMKGLGESLLNTLEEHSLQNMQLKPTRENNCLDLLCTNKPSIIKCINTFPGFSDHDFVVVDTVLKPVTSKKAPRKIYKWSKAHWDKMRFDTQAFTNEALDCTSLTVQELYGSFIKHMKTMLNLYVPSSWSRTRTDLPWISPELKRQCSKN